VNWPRSRADSAALRQIDRRIIPWHASGRIGIDAEYDYAGNPSAPSL